MGDIRPPLPVKLFTGILTSIPEIVPPAEARLVAHFGAVDLRSRQIVFDKTHYYDEEMGTPIYRYFISFEKLIEPSTIATANIRTNGLEAQCAGECSVLPRPINLDPGYLEQSKIVLASTKNFFHRILIADGIYAEVTLHFRDGKWQAFPWTFPDYKTDQYHEYFTSLRNRYREQLAGMGIRVKNRSPE
ncbi:MAG: hypothetical protein H6Q07_1292 [Acidobacteria bacterium]|nr:hypothetical protein [Acidobacteriota bacterium]